MIDPIAVAALIAARSNHKMTAEILAFATETVCMEIESGIHNGSHMLASVINEVDMQIEIAGF